MDDERKLRESFLRLLELEDETAQREELARLATEQPALAQRVEKLLRASQVDDSFLETPAARSLNAVLGTQTGNRKRLESNLHDLFERMGIIGQSLGSFGSYELKRVVKVGASSIVFEAFDAHVRRRVAIKCWWPSLLADERERERVLGEARSLARVDDPHVIQVLTVVDRGDVLGVLFPWIEGPTLDRWLENHPQRLSRETFSIAAGIVQAIEAVHRAGIVHRDIKPQNIVIDVARTRPILVDFELAWDLQDETDLLPLAGTPLYMAPEAIRGDRPSRASDLFALGCVLYEMFTGKPPFMARAVDRVFQQILYENPIPVTELAPEIPPALAGLIESLLAKNPQERLPSLQSLRKLLELGAATESDELAKLPSGDSQGPNHASQEDSVGDSPALSRRSVLATAATTLAVGSGILIWRRQPSSEAEVLPRRYQPTEVTIPDRLPDEISFFVGKDTSSLDPQLIDTVQVTELDRQGTTYWAPNKPNTWGEVRLRFRRFHAEPIVCALLGIPVAVFNLLDATAEAKLLAGGLGEELLLLEELLPKPNGLQNIGGELNVTSLIGEHGLEVRVRLKASKKLRPPVPQDLECYAAAQCGRHGVRDTMAILRVWYGRRDA